MCAAGWRVDVDFATFSGETQREPFLRLSAIASFPGVAGDGFGNVIGQPVADLAELFDRANICFFIKLAQRRPIGVLIGIDAALRHLPDMRLVDVLQPFLAPADEDLALAVENGKAGAGAIGQIFEGGHVECS